MPTEAAYLEKAAEGVLRHLPDDDAQALRDWLSSSKADLDKLSH